MARGSNQVRIIGGRFRGRRLEFPDHEGLRPTPDRVRETLFNWLTPSVVGARCLDAFAGSGALGFEAASRGAREVVMLERAAPVARRLAAHAETLSASSIQVCQADALAWLEGAAEPFDLVFLDPPFARDLLGPVIARLAEHGWIAPGGRVYIESASGAGLPPLPPGWELVRDKTAGQVRYGLVMVSAAALPATGDGD